MPGQEQAGRDSGVPEDPYITPNEFEGSDVERINQAIESAAGTGRRVVIPRLNRAADGEREIWLLDSAILVPGHTTLELNNCHIKLSDRSRDNMIRSANCGAHITDIQPISDVHIYGVGEVLLEGADRPRATGDSGRTLGMRRGRPRSEMTREERRQSYGTDAGVEGERQTGDWRNIGILFAHVHDFRIENLKIKDSHAWAISLERCSRGYINRIEFDSRIGKVIDGHREVFWNQDGLNLRVGCQDIIIENLSGRTGDDLLALTNTARAEGGRGPGGLRGFQITGNIYRGEEDDTRRIHIRGIRGGSHCNVVRLLNTRQGKMYDIFLDDVVDLSRRGFATVHIGSQRYGGPAPMGYTRRLFLSNIRGGPGRRHTVIIRATLADSLITNILHGSEGEPLTYESGMESVRNVHTEGLRSAGEEPPDPADRAPVDPETGLLMVPQHPDAEVREHAARALKRLAEIARQHRPE